MNDIGTGCFPECSAARAYDVRKGRRLEYFTLGWNLTEAGVAVAAGIVAGSIALVGFGVDSVIECLSGANLRILGQSNDTATLQQFNVLGTYSYKLFVSCDAANEQSCRDLGVARYPTTIYNNTGYANIYAPAFFSQLTGCTPA